MSSDELQSKMLVEEEAGESRDRCDMIEGTALLAGYPNVSTGVNAIMLNIYGALYFLKGAY
jgi:hypothetical protein